MHVLVDGRGHQEEEGIVTASAQKTHPMDLKLEQWNGNGQNGKSGHKFKIKSWEKWPMDRMVRVDTNSKQNHEKKWPMDRMDRVDTNSKRPRGKASCILRFLLGWWKQIMRKNKQWTEWTEWFIYLYLLFIYLFIIYIYIFIKFIYYLFQTERDLTSIFHC